MDLKITFIFSVIKIHTHLFKKKKKKKQTNKQKNEGGKEGFPDSDSGEAQVCPWNSQVAAKISSL